MTGQQVVAHHDLYQVERSFLIYVRPRRRPGLPPLRDSIEAHLTIVWTALAASCGAQTRTGRSISKIVKALCPLRTATITPRTPADQRATSTEVVTTKPDRTEA